MTGYASLHNPQYPCCQCHENIIFYLLDCNKLLEHCRLIQLALTLPVRTATQNVNLCFATYMYLELARLRNAKDHFSLLETDLTAKLNSYQSLLMINTT